jgi:hypothetical protein
LQVDSVTRSAHPQEHFIAVGAELGVFDVPGLNQDQVANRLPLDKQEFIASEGARTRAGCDFHAIPLVQPGEERRSTHQYKVFCEVGIIGINC